MGIFQILTKEHRVMLGLTNRVERAFRAGDEAAGRKGLLVLYHALSLHEEIEDLVVAPAGLGAPPGLARALNRIALQHAEIERLRDETREFLDRSGRPGEDGARLKTLALTLARRLRAHFLAEELRLWPMLAGRAGRSIGRSLARRAQLSVDELEQRIREIEESADEYL